MNYQRVSDGVIFIYLGKNNVGQYILKNLTTGEIIHKNWYEIKNNFKEIREQK